MLKNSVQLQSAKRLLKSDKKTLNRRRQEFGEGHVMVTLSEAIVALDELRIATIESGKSSEEYMQAKAKYEEQRNILHAKCALLNGLLAAVIEEAVEKLDDIIAEEDLI